MVSMWWVVSAFLMGGFAGLLAFSLIGMAHWESEHALRAERTVGRDGLVPLRLHKDWGAKDRWNSNLR